MTTLNCLYLQEVFNAITTTINGKYNTITTDNFYKSATAAATVKSVNTHYCWNQILHHNIVATSYGTYLAAVNKAKNPIMP